MSYKLKKWKGMNLIIIRNEDLIMTDVQSYYGAVNLCGFCIVKLLVGFYHKKEIRKTIK